MDVHKADRALESHGMEGHQRLLARLGLHILENLLFVIGEEIPVLVRFLGDLWHPALLDWYDPRVALH